MIKIAPRWQFVILLAVLLFLWGGSALMHSCRRAEINAEAYPVSLPVYPVEVEIDATSQVEIDGDTVIEHKQGKSSLSSDRIGKHGTPVDRDFLDEEIPENGHR